MFRITQDDWIKPETLYCYILAIREHAANIASHDVCSEQSFGAKIV